MLLMCFKCLTGTKALAVPKLAAQTTIGFKSPASTGFSRSKHLNTARAENRAMMTKDSAKGSALTW